MQALCVIPNHQCCVLKTRFFIVFVAHVYEHTGVKPFVCEHCPKRFTTPKTKRIHMLRHNTLQQFL